MPVRMCWRDLIVDLSKIFGQHPGLSQKAIFLGFATKRAICFISRLVDNTFQMFFDINFIPLNNPAFFLYK